MRQKVEASLPVTPPMQSYSEEFPLVLPDMVCHRCADPSCKGSIAGTDLPQEERTCFKKPEQPYSITQR